VSYLRLHELSKSFGETRVLERVSLDVSEGETLVLLGPSGSGKTTLLRMIAGFEAADAGRIEIAGSEITRLPPARRRFGMVFQHYALFPHLSVAENVAFGLESGSAAPEERAERVAEVLELVDLRGFGARRIHQISGGQQQRVALARALAPRPRVLLLDEPLSNLDRTLRERTRREIGDTLARVGITAVWVTHEQDEAFDVGDRVAVLNRGSLEQVGSPQELYLEPATRFVAGFVGRASAVRGDWRGDGQVSVAGSDATWRGVAAGEFDLDAAVELVFRPEALELVAAGAPDALPVRVVDRRYAGSQTFFTVESATGDRFEVIAPADAAAPGDDRAVLAGSPAPRVFRRDV
jgi:ABC-type Fe3+/spermidine/putrescine transport system ATPase subunit